MPPARVSLSSLLLALMLSTSPTEADAQAIERKDANYDESKVGEYTLPDPLLMANGKKVTTSWEWVSTRRGEILELFRTHVYGHTPPRVDATRFELASVDPHALGNTATRKEITVHLTAEPDGPTMSVLLYVPNAAPKPVPAFLGPNFGGNQAVSKDPGISLAKSWAKDDKEKHVVNSRVTEASRGSEASRCRS